MGRLGVELKETVGKSRQRDQGASSLLVRRKWIGSQEAGPLSSPQVGCSCWHNDPNTVRSKERADTQE